MKNESILTRREKQVISLAAQWKSRKEIAQELGIDGETVKAHLANIRRKFNVNKTTKAIIIARAESIIII